VPTKQRSLEGFTPVLGILILLYYSSDMQCFRMSVGKSLIKKYDDMGLHGMLLKGAIF
jgi:hypothetical protein